VEDILYRFAEDTDIPMVRRFLSTVNLPYEDIDKHISHCLLAIKKDHLAGMVGIEIAGNTALLRSLAVDEIDRNKHIGSTLFDKIRSYAQLNDVKELYLLTATAAEFFERKEFKRINRDEVPEEIKRTEEFKNICPSTAVCMKREIVLSTDSGQAPIEARLHTGQAGMTTL